MSITSNGPQTQPKDEEIDLARILSGLGLLIKNFFTFLLTLLLGLRRITIKYKYVILAIFIFGMAIGYVSHVRDKEFYRSTMLLSSEYFNGRLVENGIEKLNLLTGEKNKKQLSKVLGISEDLAVKIRNLESEPFVSEEEIVELEVLKEQLRNAGAKEVEIGKVLKQLEIENRNTYTITLRVYDSEVIDHLTDPIVNYFKNNPYIKKRIESNRLKLEARKKKYHGEIEKLDSLKFGIYMSIEGMANKSREGSNNVVLSESGIGDPVDLFREGVSYYDRLLNANEELFLSSDFELIDGFTTFNRPDNDKLSTILFTSGLIALVIAYFMIILIELNKYLGKMEKERVEGGVMV